MRLLLYEYLTGGGLWSLGTPANDSLLREGLAMTSALATDFCQLAGVEVFVLCDARLERSFLPRAARIHEVHSEQHERSLLASLATRCDWTLLIAPELNGILLERCRLVESVGGQLLSPDSTLIQLASDKHATAEHLAAAGLPVPRGCRLRRGTPLPADLAYPAVLKPVDGAGSAGLVRMDRCTAPFTWPDHVEFRLEELRPGKPASVSLLCGPAGNHVLPAAEQYLSEDGRFRYLGGRLPLDEPEQERAQALARRAAEALPTARGYIGIDLVLGERPAEDVIIEVNPRLTTSYCGLRALARVNLAEAMLAVVRGRKLELSFRRRAVEFAADGRLSGATHAVAGVGYRRGESQGG